jgi:hypothetical protein
MLRSLPVLALAALLAAPAAATTISFQNGIDGYAGADNESYSFDGTIHQDQIRMDLPSASQPAGSYAWIVFTGLFGEDAIPEGATIVSATLEGLVRNPFGAATATRLLADVASRPYGAGASVLDGAGSFFDDAQLVTVAHAACADAVECAPPVPIAWDVTALVQAWANGAANHGLLLLPETTNGGKLFATDDPNPALRPRLVVTYTGGGLSVPEPTALTLLALALAPTLRRRA